MHEKKLKRLDTKNNLGFDRDWEWCENKKRCQCHDGKETGQELNL